jgi:dihydroorotate dehydrogenase electron transfer subunit
VTAPFGRRLCEVVGNEAAGHYRLFEIADPGGPDPAPGQFYMLASGRGWGGEEGRPHLARAFSVCRTRGDRLGFLADAIGPGTDRLASLERGEGVWLVGPLGIGFSTAPPDATPLLVAGGVGLAPLVILAESLRDAGRESHTLAGFRSAGHAEAARLLPASPSLATDDGSAGHHGFVTELLRSKFEQSQKWFVYACGPPAMLESVRALCAERAVPAELALEEAMACGFGACFGCVVPTRDGYRRICVDGPVVAASDLEETWLER